MIFACFHASFNSRIFFAFEFRYVRRIVIIPVPTPHTSRTHIKLLSSLMAVYPVSANAHSSRKHIHTQAHVHKQKHKSPQFNVAVIILIRRKSDFFFYSSAFPIPFCSAQAVKMVLCVLCILCIIIIYSCTARCAVVVAVFGLDFSRIFSLLYKQMQSTNK